jgi:hypothetical protein
MALVRRVIKGTPLTFAEGDANLVYLEGLATNTGSFLTTTGSNSFSGSQIIAGNLNVTGSVLVSGSLNITNNINITSGSINIATGSISIAGANILNTALAYSIIFG